MPLYLFENIETGEVQEVLFGMNDEKTYNGPNGQQHGLWKRIYIAPRASVDTKIDPNSSKQFVEKLRNKNETLGTMWDRSAELSAQRAEKNGGVDPVKEKFYADHKKLHRGRPHIRQIQEQHKKAQQELQTSIQQAAKKLGID